MGRRDGAWHSACRYFGNDCLLSIERTCTAWNRECRRSGTRLCAPAAMAGWQIESQPFDARHTSGYRKGYACALYGGVRYGQETTFYPRKSREDDSWGRSRQCVTTALGDPQSEFERRNARLDKDGSYLRIHDGKLGL